MERLKSCPFCGNPEVVFDAIYSYFRKHTIYCCGCDMIFTVDDYTAKEDDVAKAWNRRVNDG